MDINVVDVVEDSDSDVVDVVEVPDSVDVGSSVVDVVLEHKSG